ncbi:hypothetical protein, partial [Amycolatopsis echigonensis]
APQRRQRTASTDEHREVPVTDPAELAQYADHESSTDDGGAFVDLGVDDTELALDADADGHVDLDSAA